MTGGSTAERFGQDGRHEQNGRAGRDGRHGRDGPDGRDDAGVTYTHADDETLHVGLVVAGDLESTSGGFRYDRELVARLRERGDAVDVIALPRRGYLRGLADGVDPRVRRRLDRDVDVLVQDGLCHPAVWRHNRRLTGPDAVVGLVHHLRADDPTERFGRGIAPFERRFLRSVDATVATSAFVRDRVAALAPAAASAPSIVAHPAGRAERAAASAAHVRDRAAEGPLRVVFVGTVVPRKDPETLLEAVARIADRREDVRVTVVGSLDADPGYASRLRSRAVDLGIDDRVTFAGELSDDELDAAVASAHVCCVPARYEAFGMVHLEAMERGVVPVAGAVGGVGEFVRDGTNGFLVTPGDDRELADRLATLAADRDRLGRLGVAALRTAEAHPTWTETADRIRRFLSAVASAGRGSPDHAGADVTAATGGDRT